MNAYELADEAMEHYNAEKQKGFNVNWMREVADMLRQQADQIKELEAKYQQEFDYAEKLLKEQNK
jgi:uncharacterized protein (UPF0335 family)